MILEGALGRPARGAVFLDRESRVNDTRVLATVLAFLLVTICALVIAVYFASLSVVRKAVSDAALGRVIFDSLFEYALGVSGEDIGERPTLRRFRLTCRADRLRKRLIMPPNRFFPRNHLQPDGRARFFWLAKQIQRISIWATVKVIVKSCSNDGNSVNMFELRDRLASTIDSGVVSYLKQYFSRIAFTVILAASLIQCSWHWVSANYQYSANRGVTNKALTGDRA